MSADVSVVIPAYNAERYIAAAVESAAAQTVKPREIIVIDDGSTDRTAAIVALYSDRVQYVAQENRGVAAARNHGIERSAGRYVAFLDADDLWMPEKLERQADAMAKSGLRASFTAHLVVDDEMKPLFENHNPGEGTLHDLLTIGNVVGSPSSVVCERAVFREVGGFDGALSLCADWEMWIRIATATAFAPIDAPLIQYRLHDDNMSRNVPLLESDSRRVLEKVFALPALPDDARALKRSALGHNWMVLAGSYFRAGRMRDAMRCGIRSVSHDPRQVAQLLRFGRRAVAGTMGERSVTQRPRTAGR